MIYSTADHSGCVHDRTWLDHIYCPCGHMHERCTTCATATDGCPWQEEAMSDTQRAAIQKALRPAPRPTPPDGPESHQAQPGSRARTGTKQRPDGGDDRG